ncbi:hypothetical protein TWF225_003840 [Orbilia oligospora]|uniref:Uncharacterized protein n=1 Tax=Orbilia oligospora TaxID=2813651 RepID=A0A8H2HMD1_ORBOL|nr:hypothetical protein TWF225_003840 [Orbilia oligospora]KAF3248565.1 hypothetical protein TWF128_008287 [Orbilia oligospora]KAF3258611.1 hypothetical protein TWF217_005386 [Orbilia oligospora]TGJ64533.1 hypothetical protein EYR41_010581 [Orbilia oligospora]
MISTWFTRPISTRMVTPVASYFPNGTAKVAAYAAVPVVGYFAAPVVLGAVGFSATGPVAGSYAAAWQSSIGVVQAGSTFAALQSAAMTGCVSVAGGAVGAVAPIAKAGKTLWSWGRNATRSS